MASPAFFPAPSLSPFPPNQEETREKGECGKRGTEKKSKERKGGLERKLGKVRIYVCMI